ncbi:MAG: hypothetical protein M1820_005745 [Bogoriella megaspora]|nr:MAG: hypothetical protein M1820_005745 [Bogoriella megaspora]
MSPSKRIKHERSSSPGYNEPVADGSANSHTNKSARQAGPSRAAVSPSPELGEFSDGVVYHPRTGRPIRKVVLKKSLDNGFVHAIPDAFASEGNDSDSSQSSSSNDDTDMAPSIFRPRKRRRTVSPELSPVPSLDILSFTDSTPDSLEEEPLKPLESPTVIVNLNLPPDHQGPLPLQLDLRSIHEQVTAVNHLMRSPNTQGSMKRASFVGSKIDGSGKASFLTLPPETRNNIYRLVFVDAKPFNFNRPSNFQRSAQLLATCQQICNEGRSILYSEARFSVERDVSTRSWPFVFGSSEVGYKDFLRFLRQIGTHNLEHIRDVEIIFEDGSSTSGHDHRAEEARYMHSEELLSCLRILGRESKLKKLSLSFQGRRQLAKTDRYFLEILKKVKADEVEIVPHLPYDISDRSSDWARARWNSKQTEAVREDLLKSMNRKKKLFDEGNS